MAAWVGFIVVSALVGIVRAYSPVPFWDMWDGYLWFFLQASNGDFAAWWVPHNEHRILLSRLLFWFDLRYLNGAGWSLVAANYLLLGAAAYLFYRLLRARAATATATPVQVMLGLGLTGWLFSWMQYENLIWGFQSQFILAQLLPLCAFYWLYKSLGGATPTRHFLIACLLGVASIGTMANGILALPLMLVYAVYLRQGMLRIGILLMLSGAGLTLYFHGYHSPPAHGSLLVALRETPLDLLRYVLYYLGGPFYVLFGGKGLGRLAAIVGGVFFLVSTVRFARSTWRQPVKDALELALFLFLLYILGTAVGTAGGRVIFGVSQALTSRYTTPTLMAWAVLLVMYAPAVLRMVKVKNRLVVSSFVLIAVLLATVQLPAWRSQQSVLFERKLAVLALALGIRDESQIGTMYPNAERALEVAGAASAHHLSVFGMYPYAQIKQQMGATAPALNLPLCEGSLDSVRPVVGDSRYMAVRGSVWVAGQQGAPQMVRFIDRHQRVAGFALVDKGGRIDPDRGATQGIEAPIRYAGYVVATGIGDMAMRGEYPACQMALVVQPSS